MRDTIDYLKDIKEAVDSIRVYVEGLDFDQFCADRKTKRAVVAEFLVIGEAVTRLPERILVLHDELPWSRMIGMRNRLVHGYFGIDYKIVWTTIQDHLPPLANKLDDLIRAEKANAE